MVIRHNSSALVATPCCQTDLSYIQEVVRSCVNMAKKEKTPESSTIYSNEVNEFNSLVTAVQCTLTVIVYITYITIIIYKKNGY